MRTEANPGACRFNARHKSEHVVDRMRRPGVRVRSRIAGNLRPRAEVHRQKLAPRVERVQILVCHAGMVESARQVEAEIVGSAQDAVRRCSRLDGQDLPQDLAAGLSAGTTS